LNLTVKSFLDSSKANITIVYSVDGKTNTTIDTQSTPVYMGIQSYYLITGWATLPEMPEGSHSITVYGKYEFPGSYHNIGLDNRTVYFTVNDGSPPSISILSPANTSYAAIYDPYITVPLSFETNASLSWVGYSLDGSSNITVSQNGTLIEIPHESRSLTLYANDTAGNWATPQTVYYSIAFNLGIVPSAPFPTLLVVATSVAVVAIVGVGLLVYFKKKRVISK
jgi:hypothetical protein